MEEVRWGIIGCGNVTEVKSGPAFNKAPGSKLVAVMRRNGNLAEDYARRHGVPKWYDDAEKLIEDSEVNAIYIATPPGSHREYTIRAAKAGKPVYVEKPMALNYAECLEMIDACNQAGVKLFVAYYRRSLPLFVKVKEWIDSGAIGEVRFIAIRMFTPVNQSEAAADKPHWHVVPEIAGGGYVYDVGSHQVDLMDYFFGPIQEVRAFAGNQAGMYAVEDIVSASFRFESGVYGNAIWCFTLPERERSDRIEIFGSKGKIVTSTFDGGPAWLINDDGEVKYPFSSPENIQQPLIETMVSELLGGQKKCPSSAQSGARASWVLEELNREYKREKGLK
jgi:predicted dehydrogenase